jgi:hypothetical protein
VVEEITQQEQEGLGREGLLPVWLAKEIEKD